MTIHIRVIHIRPVHSLPVFETGYNYCILLFDRAGKRAFSPVFEGGSAGIFVYGRYSVISKPGCRGQLYAGNVICTLFGVHRRADGSCVFHFQLVHGEIVCIIQNGNAILVIDAIVCGNLYTIEFVIDNLIAGVIVNVYVQPVPGHVFWNITELIE